MANDPWAAPEGDGTVVARGEGSGDLLPERLRLKGWPAVAREHIWWRNARVALMVRVGFGAMAWGALQGSGYTIFAGVVMAGMAVRLGLRQVAYGLPPSLAARIQALHDRSSVEEFEDLAA